MDRPLRRRDLAPDPFVQFERWWTERGAATAQYAESIALATASGDGAPSLRMVLLKGRGSDGLRFFTNHESRKGRDMAENPQAALLAYDEVHGRQLRVEGRVEALDATESDAYWRSRPLGSRLSAAVSRQSQPVADRAEMEAAREEARQRWGNEVPRPPRWGGYRLVPTRFEFWQHRDDRFHDRFVYEREGEGWRIERLWP